MWEVNLYVRVSGMILMYVHACGCCNVSARYIICVGISLTVSISPVSVDKHILYR
jgi:hypothetical protein